MTITSVCGGLKTLRKDHRNIDNNSAFAICAIILLVLVRWTINMGGSKSNFSFFQPVRHPDQRLNPHGFFLLCFFENYLKMNKQLQQNCEEKIEQRLVLGLEKTDSFSMGKLQKGRYCCCCIVFKHFLQMQTFNSNFPNFKKIISHF